MQKFAMCVHINVHSIQTSRYNTNQKNQISIKNTELLSYLDLRWILAFKQENDWKKEQDREEEVNTYLLLPIGSNIIYL